MSKASRTLRIKVGESLEQAGARAGAAMKAAAAGRAIQPYFGVGFPDVGPMLGVFTPRRWELIAALREAGPSTIAELARRLGRNYKNVHADVQTLIEWMVVERGIDGRVSVPWSEIVLDMTLPEAIAA